MGQEDQADELTNEFKATTNVGKDGRGDASERPRVEG